MKQLFIGIKTVFKKDYMFRLKRHSPRYSINMYKYIENVLLGISPASNCSWPTFRNPVSVPSSKAGGRLWGVRGSKV